MCENASCSPYCATAPNLALQIIDNPEYLFLLALIVFIITYGILECVKEMEKERKGGVNK